MKLSRAPLRRARIEIIPMIDTVFFLLVFFMMASLSMTLHRGMLVSLPRAAAGGPATSQSAAITIARDGGTQLDGQRVEMDALAPSLRTRLVDASELAVVIHADEAVAHGRVVEVLDAVRAAGVSRLAIAIAPKAAGVRL